MARFDALLLGREYETPGEVDLAVLAGGVAAAGLTVGGEAVLRRKDGLGSPNEDAVLAITTGSRTLLAVADGHHGAGTSHFLLERLAAQHERWARTPRQLALWLERLPDPDLPAQPVGGSTLLVVSLDHRRGHVVGVSFGDSVARVIDPEGDQSTLTTANRRYVNMEDFGSLARERATTFQAHVPAGSLLVVHSDGVNECCYGQPERSVQDEHVAALYEDVGADPEAMTAGLITLALDGIAPDPGGEDNIAVATVRV